MCAGFSFEFANVRDWELVIVKVEQTHQPVNFKVNFDDDQNNNNNNNNNYSDDDDYDEKQKQMK
jgi:hypothetical protein